MKAFAELQADFQRAILDGDEGVLADILDSNRETRAVLFGVYRDAYALRLVEAMAGDHEALAACLGEDGFDEMARAYIAARPSNHPNLRWFTTGLADFLATTAPYRDRPHLSEIAELETTLSAAFDAPDVEALDVSALTRVDPDSWRHLVFRSQPHSARLDQSSNAFAIWSAHVDGEPAPEPTMLTEPARLLIWRQNDTPMARALAVEEAMLWDEAGAGIPFGVLCEMAATYVDPDQAAGRAAGYLKAWLDGGLLTGFELTGPAES